MNITVETANELYALGFSYRHYQAHCQKGMVYYYNGGEWVIGGNADELLSDVERKIVTNGTWLPSEIHLIEWLQDNDFVFAIVNTDGFFDVTCKDTITETEYHSKVPTLDAAMAAVVSKILKRHEREFDKKEKIYGIIE